MSNYVFGLEDIKQIIHFILPTKANLYLFYP